MKMNNYEIENAVIESVDIDTGRGNHLNIKINVEYQMSGQSFGGYYLGSTDSPSLAEPNALGYCIARLFQILEINSFQELAGKPIRVHIENGIISGIGHFLKDQWFMVHDELNTE